MNQILTEQTDIFTERCYTEHGIATASHLSVCDVEVSRSHRLEFFKNNSMVS